jgi:hypothetical protein
MCKQLVVALALLIAANSAGAQCLGSCCSAGSNTDITNHSSNSKKGDWLISTAYSIMEYHPFTDEELIQWSTIDNATFTVKSQQSMKLALQYNITDRLKVNASIPYNFSFDNREGHTHEGDHTEIHNYADVRGLGDATFLGSYQWLGDNQKGWQFSTGLGIKAPTGQTEVLSSTNVGVPEHLQPGTGSWDPVATVSVKKQVRQWMFTGDVFGKIATTAKDHNMGDYLSGTAAAFWKAWQKDDQVVSSVVLVGALQSEFSSKMRMPPNHIHNGSDTDAPLMAFENSGFTRIFISGGTLVSLGKHFTIPFSISVPVYQHLNGYQVKMQWKSTLGLSLNF